MTYSRLTNEGSDSDPENNRQGEESKLELSETEKEPENIENTKQNDDWSANGAAATRSTLIANKVEKKLERLRHSSADTSEWKPTLVQLAREKANTVFDATFHLLMAQILFFFQFRNCELIGEAVGNTIDSITISTCAAAQVASLANIKSNPGLIITCSIASYALISAMIIAVHVRSLKDHYVPPVQNLFQWTNRLPVVGILFEIPFCVWYAPYVTIILWVIYSACAAGLVYLCYVYEVENPAVYILNVLKYVIVNKTSILENFETDNTNILDHIGGSKVTIDYTGTDNTLVEEIKTDEFLSQNEDGKSDRSAFLLTACLVAFDLYKLTGYITQYHVINKSAKIQRRQDEKKIIADLKEYIKESQA